MTTIPTSDLPAVIARYLDAHRSRDLVAALACFAPDATVVDEDRLRRGRDEIREWLESAGSEYTYTTDLIGAERVDAEHYDAIQHLEGDFPGGVVDLRYRFAIDGDLIAELRITA